MTDKIRKPVKTDDAVEKAKCAEGKRVTRHSCGGLGLFLDVKAGGARSFMLCIMVNRKRLERGLGSYPQVKLADAQERAIVWARQLRDGAEVGVKAAKASAAASISFKEAARRYLDFQDREGNYKKTLEGMKGVHRRQWDYTLESFVFPKIGNMDVNEIRISHLTPIFEPMWKAKYATASKTRSRIALVLDYSVDQGWRDEDLMNPARHKSTTFKRPKGYQTKSHAAVEVEDMPGLMVELRKLESVSAAALEITILTGVRTTETRAAKWNEIDFESHMWIIPASRMKANKAHRVPLSDRAIDVFERLLPLRGPDGWVFPSKESCLGNMAQLACLKGLLPEATVHGFRSTFRDWAIRQGVIDEVRAACSAHSKQDKVQAAYERKDFFEQRVPVMQAWADYLA